MKRVTLDDILVKPQRVDITVKKGKPTKNAQGVLDYPHLTFWIRPTRQAERDISGAAARRASRTLRKSLETEGTEERETLVLDEVLDADIDSLRVLWVTEKVIERAVKLRQDSLEDREYVPEPEGDDLTSRDLDLYENEVDDAEERRELSVGEAIVRAREELEEQVKHIDEEKLRELAIPVQIESVLNRVYETEFVAQIIYRCTFNDKTCKDRAFEDIEQVYALGHEAMTKLTNAHMSFMIDPEAVKNLAGGLKS